jgi:hypothetical protein
MNLGRTVVSHRFAAVQSDVGSHDGNHSEEEVLLPPQSVAHIASWRTPTPPSASLRWRTPVVVGAVGVTGMVVALAASVFGVVAVTAAWLLLT